MKIHQKCENFTLIDYKWIQESKQGKWNDWKRVYVIQDCTQEKNAEGQPPKDYKRMAVVSLNCFERMFFWISQIFNVNYFQNVFKSKRIYLYPPNRLDAMISQHSLLIGMINHRTSYLQGQTLEKQTNQLTQKDFDAYLQTLPWPKEDDFAPEEWKIVEKIITEIKDSHYDRVVKNFPGVTMHFMDIDVNVIGGQDVHATSPKEAQILDKLVKMGTIDSWNVASRRCKACIKIDKTDEVQDYDPGYKTKGYSWKEWRDLAVIEREALFKENNQVILSDEQKKELDSILDQTQKENLKLLIEGLNQKVTPGVYIWIPSMKQELDASEKILRELKQRNIIFDYKRYVRNFEVIVKADDNL